MEAVQEPPVGCVQNRRIRAASPIARQCPLIELQFFRRRVEVLLIQCCAAGRGEGIAAPVADVGFRRLQIGPVRAEFYSNGFDRE